MPSQFAQTIYFHGPSHTPNHLCSQLHLRSSTFDPNMPRKFNRNLRVHNVFSLGPQPTLPCPHPNCSRSFFDLSGHSNHMRTTHSHDLPLVDPPNISPVLSSAQCGPSQSSTSSPAAPSPSPTFRHTDQDIPLNANIPSTEADWLQDLTGMDVNPLPSPIINDAPCLASPHPHLLA